MFGFAGAILAGTALLLLPFSAADGRSTGIVDALFTATSAVCVTGLTVLDTATHWSGFGLAVIMLLIQLGGLGIMIFASLVGLLIARRFSMRARMTAAVEARALSTRDVKGLVRGIVLMSLTIEAVVFAFLFPRFLFEYDCGIGEAAWHALFHSVSSFNNAGFALYSDNLIPFAADPFIVLPICGAVILGGLGFPVLLQLRKEFRKPLHWSMNTRIMLWGTVVLLVAGTVYITALEWSNDRTFGTVVLVALGAVMTCTITLMIMTGDGLDEVLFESISAFATVGLSTGITADLPPGGDIVLIILMFLGRLGPLTLGSALALRERRILYELPKERPAIG